MSITSHFATEQLIELALSISNQAQKDKSYVPAYQALERGKS